MPKKYALLPVDFWPVQASDGKMGLEIRILLSRDEAIELTLG